MIEIAHPVDSIVAFQTIPPKLGLVLFHEFLVMIRVATGAGRQLEFPDILAVAGGAGHRLIVVIPGVARQAESEVRRVVEGLPLQ
jgi:hypothetical protein